MQHKGYTGVVEVDVEANLITGVVLGTTDVITFQGETVVEARKSFEESVDFYLKMCEKSGKAPEKPFSGKFVVRIAPAVHRTLAVTAEALHVSLNDLVKMAFDVALRQWVTPGGVGPDPEIDIDPAPAHPRRKRRRAIDVS